MTRLSMVRTPGQGWIDRVWNLGWAYDDGKLAQTPALMLGLAASDEAGCAERGYDTAIVTQLCVGALDYCGFDGARLEMSYDTTSDDATRAAMIDRARALERGDRSEEIDLRPVERPDQRPERRFDALGEGSAKGVGVGVKQCDKRHHDIRDARDVFTSNHHPGSSNAAAGPSAAITGALDNAGRPRIPVHPSHPACHPDADLPNVEI